ncbi:MAG: hypothetical protein IJ920_09965, partial [Paludibacteraceae bacterium]|nr:hypothetical protein [Paludibacteraceae bacterium]
MILFIFLFILAHFISYAATSPPCSATDSRASADNQSTFSFISAYKGSAFFARVQIKSAVCGE